MSCINLLAVHSSRGDAGGARLEENPTLQGLTSSSPKSVLILAHGTSPVHLQDLSDLFLVMQCFGRAVQGSKGLWLARRNSAGISGTMSACTGMLWSAETSL